MVRGQPVVFRTDKLLEKEPGAPRQAAHLLALIRRKWRGRVVGWAAAPIGNLGRKQPREQEWHGNEQRGRIEQDDKEGERHRQKRSRNHLTKSQPTGKHPHRVRIARPMQHVFAGDKQPKESDCNSTECDCRFIWNKN